jgi:electron transfer flavoprotein alpha subunit
MTNKVLVLVEHWGGKLKSVSWEAIGFGQKLAEQNNFVTRVVILGNEVKDLATQVSERSGLEVLCVSDERLYNYTPEVYCDLFLQVIQQESPFLVLMGHTYQVMDFAPKLATMLDRGFISNCVDFQIEAGRMVFVRNAYSGKLNIQVGLKGDPPYFVSLHPGNFNDHEFIGRKLPKVVNLEIRVSDKLVIKRKVQEIVQEVQGKIDLSKAEVIVAGGRGLGSKENFKTIFDLAKVLRASIGATRPVIDNGWLPKDHQVGASGHSVAPQLYIACGISGQIHHLVGIAGARYIVAINKDPYAPIYQVADYGIVGDLFTIVPAITESVKEIGSIM